MKKLDQNSPSNKFHQKQEFPNIEEDQIIQAQDPQEEQLQFLKRTDPKSGQVEVRVLMDFFFDLKFESAKEIHDTVNGLFLPLDIKLKTRCKERFFDNGYYLYILHCSQTLKLEYQPHGTRQFRKRENECKFNMSFSKFGMEPYSLSGGHFIHNHELTCEDIKPQEVKEFDEVLFGSSVVCYRPYENQGNLRFRKYYEPSRRPINKPDLQKEAVAQVVCTKQQQIKNEKQRLLANHQTLSCVKNDRVYVKTKYIKTVNIFVQLPDHPLGQKIEIKMLQILDHIKLGSSTIYKVKGRRIFGNNYSSNQDEDISENFFLREEDFDQNIDAKNELAVHIRMMTNKNHVLEKHATLML